MATKNYMINDKWLDLDKQNIVELQSVDGVLDSMKVNGSEIVTPSGKIEITENGSDIDIAQYALADVNVPQPTGKITITENGTDINIAQYALADVNVEGGSSDFSTAEVTLVNSDNAGRAVMIPVLYEAAPPIKPDAHVVSVVNMLANETLVLNVPLYKGHCSIVEGISGDRMSGDTVATSFAVTSGSATTSLNGVDITGDCTITVSAGE